MAKYKCMQGSHISLCNSFEVEKTGLFFFLKKKVSTESDFDGKIRER